MVLSVLCVRGAISALHPALRVRCSDRGVHRIASSPLMANAKSAAIRSLVQRRAFASSASESEDKQLVYEAPMARAVRLMKGVSVTSCTMTTFGMPVLCYMSEQSASVLGKWAMCGTIMLFGFGTTSLYHLLFQPYVLRMWVDQPPAAGDDARVTVETLTLLAQRTTREFQLSDVTRPLGGSMHPMVSFRAKEDNYFIHPEEIADEQLVKKLMGDDFKIHKKGAVIEEEEY